MRLWSNLVSIPIEPDPQPKPCPSAPDQIAWPIQRRFRCPPVTPPRDESFVTLLEMRRSERAMRSAPLREIVNALAFAMRPRFVRENDIHHRTLRPTVSAGALHAIDAVIVDWRGSARVLRYEPLTHHLELLQIARMASLRKYAEICSTILPDGPRTALALIGDERRLEALYEHPISLLWRDAGALLQTIAMVSAAYRLAFCPLGTLGSHVIDALGLDRHAARPVGCAAIGHLSIEQRKNR